MLLDACVTQSLSHSRAVPFVGDVEGFVQYRSAGRDINTLCTRKSGRQSYDPLEIVVLDGRGREAVVADLAVPAVNGVSAHRVAAAALQSTRPDKRAGKYAGGHALPCRHKGLGQMGGRLKATKAQSRSSLKQGGRRGEHAKRCKGKGFTRRNRLRQRIHGLQVYGFQ